MIDAVTPGPLTLFVDRFNYTLIQAPVTIAQNTYSVTNVDFILSTTYPTAAEEDSVIAYDIAVAGRVELRMYDLLGGGKWDCL